MLDAAEGTELTDFGAEAGEDAGADEDAAEEARDARKAKKAAQGRMTKPTGFRSVVKSAREAKNLGVSPWSAAGKQASYNLATGVKVMAAGAAMDYGKSVVDTVQAPPSPGGGGDGGGGDGGDGGDGGGGGGGGDGGAAAANDRQARYQSTLQALNPWQ